MSVPKLRFDGFSGNWVTTQLGNICSFTQGVQIPQSEQINEERDSYIRYLYIRDFFSDKFKCYVPNIYPEKIIHPHEIMMVNTGNTTGEAYTGRYGVLSNNSFKIGYDLAHFNDQFMYLFCSSELAQNQIKKFFNAGGQPHLGHKNISQILISYPKKEEQTKIASFLSAVDEKISQLTRKHELLSQYKQGMMQKLFSQQIRFKADDGSEFGEWKITSIKDAVSFIKDGTHGTHQDDPSSNLFLLSAKNLQNGKIVIDDKDRKINQKEFDSIYKNYKLQDGDILLSVVGTIGRVAIFKDYYESYAFQRSVAFMRFKKALPEFIYQLFLAKDFQNELLVRQVVSAQPGIYLGDLSKIDIKLPCLEEQTKIANFLSVIDQKIEVVAQQIEQAKQWKKGLLQQMFV
ncbi:restriction endonuclease subunit S [Acinetobacter sp. VNH17]|uniref:Restriction endonuclease subunit S n=1 Tax=Acinetobacter thutiue TaxID=2998078 RepID=A0ABT7WM21_9GAMM|nr:restriction endonuclease subunit S [Acinetobacter thutiue]MCY6411613.1 restriction endonuclease subunit S [Acinetobacter thutiue]MDN0013715.1 restriction endonuclease subunit S [Acinetobacter thutiue]